MGGGDAPPPTVDGYKVNLPEAFKESVDAAALAKDKGFQGMLSKLHAKGASQAVVDVAVETMLERGAAMRTALPQLAAADCEATLRQQEGWKTDGEYRQQVGTAFSAAKQIFGADVQAMLDTYGNDPRFIRGMAAIGKEMQEDAGPSAEAAAQIQDNLDTLMQSPAYLNGNHPQHAATVVKVNALTTQVAGTKATNGRTMSFKTA